MTINQETGLYGAYDFVYEPFFTKPWFIITLILAGIVIFVFVGYFAYRVIKTFQERNITPLMRAEKKLILIKKKSLKENDATKMASFLQEIVLIFKQYWQQNTQQEIMQYTPHEFSFILRHYCSSQKTKNEIQGFFDQVEQYLFSSEEIVPENFEKIVDHSIVLLKSLDRQLNLK